ncbi:tRNA lysidine(34) synthetase TilS [Criblamydia sequanensis]|uniref:tRNA(Ile)-lysidine synthase n=1 Tax=Candidatus Criblamydia sequanensis CRIB-18 TaxID=1437425 RepID=A0A090DWW8_9BACT|nr:tRNA lysidine(34) synthetase TilS [Criblamydia sequanensis]CDR33334.1 tRNA(Ile)-lysidine synthase [Criblamydia sequanensis CRIB-18]
MQETLERELYRFIKQHLSSNKIALLGLSGGPDSFSLYQLLLKLKIPFAVAHIDHGWRKESKEELLLLEKMAKKDNLSFFSKTLVYPDKVKNLEAFCRAARIQFFKSLVETHQMDGVFLAHHADDLAETVLKRVSEGYALPFLGGMKPVSVMKGIKILRPLLFTPKQMLLDWLSKQSVSFKPFLDSTNLDEHYLRPKMREKIIPFLEKEFGKKIKNSLVRMGKESAELTRYLDSKVEASFAGLKKNAWGSYLDFDSFRLEDYERRYLLKKILITQNFGLSDKQFESVLDHLNNFSANKQFLKDKKRVYVDRGHLFLFEKEVLPFEGEWMLKEGVNEFGDLQIEVSKIKNFVIEKKGWESLFKDGLLITLPSLDYRLGKVTPKMDYGEHKTLDKFWNEKKVPAFFRDKLPGLFSSRKLEKELLVPTNIKEDEKLYLIKITPK